MALHQLFTLAFALQLEPLPTLDYVAAHPEDGQESGGEAIRVGANTVLEPIVSRHGAHAVQTISFLLQHTKALDAVGLWSDLVALLAKADEDPSFKNLRAFFDARYDEGGRLIGADPPKKPSCLTKRLRSASRSTAFVPPVRRGSQAADARKSSFAQSIGGAAGLKLNWLRKNTDSQAGASHGEASDDEVQSSHSRDGSYRKPTAYAAPEVRIVRKPSGGTVEHIVAGSGPSPSLEGAVVKTVRFNVRLDLHNVGLAPRPPSLPCRPSGSHGTRRTSNPSGASYNRLPGQAPHHDGAGLHGGHNLDQILSPDSARSSGGFSEDVPDADHQPSIQSAFSQPSLRKSSMSNSTGRGGGGVKVARRLSMMSKLLDFGLRKRSGTERSDTHDSNDDTGNDESSLHSQSGQAVAPHYHHSKRIPSGLSNVRADANGSGSHQDDEALDVADEEDDGAVAPLRAKHGSLHRQQGDSTLLSRRRSSNGSSGRAGLLQSAISIEPDLGPVREDGMFEVERFTTRSSNDARSVSALEDIEHLSSEAREAQDRLLADGRDFITLIRTASELTLRLAAVAAADGDEGVGNGASVTTLMNEDASKQLSDRAKGKRPENSGNTTPSGTGPHVHPKASSAASTPSVRGRSFDLQRSPNPFAPADVATAYAGHRDESETWWPCGEVDPLPVSISCALGQALGWEGIMQLCYGPGSRSATEGSYAPLGRAAALDASNKQHKRTVMAWRTDVASADLSASLGGDHPPLLSSSDEGAHQQTDAVNGLSTSLQERLGLASGTAALGPVPPEHLMDAANGGRKPDVAGEELFYGLHANAATNESIQYPPGSTLKDLLGRQGEDGRTWEDWKNLARSIQGWVQDYETTRVRAGLAHEIGVEPTPQAPSVPQGGVDGPNADLDALTNDMDKMVSRHSFEGSAHDLTLQPIMSPRQLQVLTVFGSPESASGGHLGRSPSVGGASFRARLAQRASRSEMIPDCVVKDLMDRRHGFRRRAGIPEGLQAGPDGEEFEDYSWARQKLSGKHFATALTIGSDSFSHLTSQLHGSSWVHDSAWELDYLEMCVFKSPLVAERFPPPGSAIVPSARSYHPTEGTKDRTKLCPNPDEDGCWSSAEWKRWLTTIREGDIIVPAVGWQAWWTLISVLNGADRTGRTYDLQVKTPEEPFEGLTDLGAVYI